MTEKSISVTNNDFMLLAVRTAGLLEIIASLWRENPSRDLKTELFVRTVWSFGDVELNKCVD